MSKIQSRQIKITEELLIKYNQLLSHIDESLSVQLDDVIQQWKSSFSRGVNLYRYIKDEDNDLNTKLVKKIQNKIKMTGQGISVNAQEPSRQLVKAYNKLHATIDIDSIQQDVQKKIEQQLYDQMCNE